MFTQKEIDELLKEDSVTQEGSDSKSGSEFSEDFLRILSEIKPLDLFKKFCCTFCHLSFSSRPGLWDQFINQTVCPHCGQDVTIMKRKMK